MYVLHSSMQRISLRAAGQLAVSLEGGRGGPQQTLKLTQYFNSYAV